MKRLTGLGLAWGILLATPSAHAQDQPAPPRPEGTDSVRFVVPAPSADSQTTQSAASEPRRIPRLARSGIDESRWPQPTVTLLKSMVVPGWGQITNRRYLKAALAIGLETWFIAGAAYNWHKADEALDRFRAEPDPYSAAAQQSYLDYEFYQGNRGDYLWALGLTVFISMFDAYVDAHLRPYREDNIPGVEPPPGLELVIDF